MHYGVIFAVKAISADDAVNQTHEFLKKFEGVEYDYYLIGLTLEEFGEISVTKYGEATFSKFLEQVTLCLEKQQNDYTILISILENGVAKTTKPSRPEDSYKSEKEEKLLKYVAEKYKDDPEKLQKFIGANEEAAWLTNNGLSGFLYKYASEKKWESFLWSAYEVIKNHKGYFHCAIEYFNITEKRNVLPSKWDGYFFVLVNIHN